MRFNGHDRVERYRQAQEEAFRALVGDDMNGLIEAIGGLSKEIRSFKAKLTGVQMTLIMLLVGVIANLVVRL
jgi:hypothetical protein